MHFGSRIAVEEISHCLVEMSGPDLYHVLQRSRADDLPLGELEGGGIVLMKWGCDRSVAERLNH